MTIKLIRTRSALLLMLAAGPLASNADTICNYVSQSAEHPLPLAERQHLLAKHGQSDRCNQGPEESQARGLCHGVRLKVSSLDSDCLLIHWLRLNVRSCVVI